eukprot:scaffold45806_cov237-Amphora_coffeaeformis.AAC.9
MILRLFNLLCLLVTLGEATTAFNPSPLPTTRPSSHVVRKFFSLDTIEDILFPKSNDNVVEIDPHQQFLQQDFVVDGDDDDDDDDVETTRQSLVLFLHQWALQLAHDKNPQNTGLATPITVQEFKSPLLYTNNNNNNKRSDNDHHHTTNNTTLQMKIMFRPPPRYLSYNEQKSMEKGVLPDRKGGKLDSKSPGGIAISISTLTAKPGTTLQLNPTLLRLVVQRCGVDRDTIVKASSERAIVRRLKEALRIWQRVQAM